MACVDRKRSKINLCALLSEFLLAYTVAYETMDAIYVLIPNLDAVPIPGVEYYPTNNLRNGEPIPSKFPVAVSEAVMPACNRINASVTVKELDQKQTKFNNTYFAFYKSAQIMKSTKSPTGFIDKLRGVSTEVRDAKYETNKENDENRTGRKRQGNSDTSCTAQKRRHSASLFNMGSQTSMATARTYEAPNSPLDSSNILIEDPNNLSDSLKGEFERKYGIRDNWTPQEGVCLPGSGNVRCRNNAENCKKIHFIGSHSQRRNQICDSFDSHRSRRNEASECLQRHPRCQADVEGKDEYVRQAQEDGLLRLAHNSLGAWPAAHSLQAFQQHWCDSRYSGNLHLRPCPNKLSPQ